MSARRPHALRIGRTVTDMLDLDQVLTTVVESAVGLTEAEEGSLLLLDEESGDLTMRAAMNFDDEFARTFRLKIEDSLAGQVIASGKPVILDEGAPQKIKTPNWCTRCCTSRCVRAAAPSASWGSTIAKRGAR